ncbi:MAG: COG4315 family predicted lipoprotein, partial [Solirubrobacteraceae bacterium]
GAIAAVAVAPATAGSNSTTPTIKLMSTGNGKILSVKGFVLYRFSHDGNGSKNTCVKIKGCKGTWPALTTAGKPYAGPRVKASLLSTTKLPNGKHQVTYAGHPLYRYKFDTKGSTYYIGIRMFKGNWYAVNSKGKVVK